MTNKVGVMKTVSNVLKNYRNGVTLVASLAAVVSASWNLPYQQPAKYNYSQYYDTLLSTAVKTSMADYFKTSMTKGWTYYKAHYMLSNGLVNHMSLSNNAVIGANEAVSEGQGYGMILAVLNNDQVTFNKIFEAANQYMWDDNHKSYYKWQWPSGGTGAATDADIDMGLALVFADVLQKHNLWAAYTKTPNYNSRAMDIIQSIMSHMTSNGYLLPGDNWGGSGINNLDPSYFATGWMKVFDEYQTTVNYAPVIDKCYTVLAQRTAQYNKGQAPDWETSTGGTASQGAPGMGMDAIRVPYRIAMDAMWFNEPRAITFCANAKNTLSQYSNTTSKSMVLAQMGQYDQNGSIVTSTSGSMMDIAMWECSALGSQQPAFSKGCLTTTAIGLIVGQDDCFGSVQLSDQDFYFNQSLGLLGFALISGQFPNIYDDLKNGVPAAVGPAEKSAKASSLSMHSAHGGFSFTAGAGVSSVTLELYNLKGDKVYDASVKGGDKMFIPQKAGAFGPGSYVAKVTALYAERSAPEMMTEKIYWK